MNARNKLNAWWVCALVASGLIMMNSTGNESVFVIVVGVGLFWATRRGHIR